MGALSYITGLAVFFLEGVGAYRCKTSNYPGYKYCAHGCCGNGHGVYCCAYVNTSLIIGCSAAAVFSIAIAIGVVVACIKSSSRQGREVGVHTVGATTMMATTASSQHGGCAAQMVQPPAYNDAITQGPASYPPPPPYSYTQPV
ncbi:uncharacterized protein [Haliotis cracherodii]|uniref:uncharacterized protein n=1 Tax=Haliotis cracherodii TaxID=6455 RepID=UPI0039EA3DB2